MIIFLTGAYQIRFVPKILKTLRIKKQMQPLDVFYKKNLFLKISQYSQENIYAEVSFLKKVTGLKAKRDSNTGVFL